ncbi:MAG: hypothetical protein ACD_70C00036G0006 [uncultured bacterium]|nr:MAG: hypothetical protein ACD_70C00036G0006 [uncultured bacterium]OGT25392.1 MAG: hypothetical protein A3B71_04905 [Gammaproteobacteria bacterium RIFCSPHIGHO2_02_FULL_42_43]OGT28694.1 MAG: hypothetical protein A2624_00655 [Gammaproteobacteria bacterium RIFCSPHIGHO2_01_FULL_42_8]OGT51343.1 MAG: hypothetical protein A3E54_04670 [Gammaproteobacteria bacterium RIFCSPHIGHO2_12_FULL_41_25]OGT62045.1 MAG: hypothetical protein A3I77_03600 [Gammaproteobacteria bacterium RIFCSPLOWO2_02_FULL_42_14]OGT
MPEEQKKQEEKPVAKETTPVKKMRQGIDFKGKFEAVEPNSEKKATFAAEIADFKQLRKQQVPQKLTQETKNLNAMKAAVLRENSQLSDNIKMLIQKTVFTTGGLSELLQDISKHGIRKVSQIRDSHNERIRDPDNTSSNKIAENTEKLIEWGVDKPYNLNRGIATTMLLDNVLETKNFQSLVAPVKALYIRNGGSQNRANEIFGMDNKPNSFEDIYVTLQGRANQAYNGASAQTLHFIKTLGIDSELLSSKLEVADSKAHKDWVEVTKADGEPHDVSGDTVTSEKKDDESTKHA